MLMLMMMGVGIGGCRGGRRARGGRVAALFALDDYEV